MGKKSRIKKTRQELSPPDPTLMWAGEDCVHAIVPGEAPSTEKLGAMTAAYQESIRKSPLWDMMVEQFGEAKAEALLKECKAKLE